MSRAKANSLRIVEFICHAGDAQSVSVAGTFNNWSSDANALRDDGNGLWTARLELPLGRHEFKFVVDGGWVCEMGCKSESTTGCPKCVPNEYGTMNRFIDVT